MEMLQTEGNDGAAMSFGEIGRRMGISRGGAWMLYQSAIRKLRKRPERLRKFREMVELRRRVKPQPAGMSAPSRSRLRLVAALIALMLPLAAWGQEGSQEQDKAPKQGEGRRMRLEYIIVNAPEHKIEWAMTAGKLDKNGACQMTGEPKLFEIDMPRATIEHQGETERIRRETAAHMHQLVDAVIWYLYRHSLSYEQKPAEKKDAKVMEVAWQD